MCALAIVVFLSLPPFLSHSLSLFVSLSARGLTEINGISVQAVMVAAISSFATRCRQRRLCVRLLGWNPPRRLVERSLWRRALGVDLYIYRTYIQFCRWLVHRLDWCSSTGIFPNSLSCAVLCIWMEPILQYSYARLSTSRPELFRWESVEGFCCLR